MFQKNIKIIMLLTTMLCSSLALEAAENLSKNNIKNINKSAQEENCDLKFETPEGMTLDRSENIYLSTGHNVVKILGSGPTRASKTIIGGGLNDPKQIVFQEAAGIMYINDNGDIKRRNNDGSINNIKYDDGTIFRTFLSKGLSLFGYNTILLSGGNSVRVSEPGVFHFIISPNQDTSIINSSDPEDMDTLSPIVADSRGLIYYVANCSGGGQKLIKYNRPSGNYLPITSCLNDINYLAIDRADTIYFTNLRDGTVYKIPSGGTPIVIAGEAGRKEVKDGIGTGAHFKKPNGITVNRDGSIIYVSEYDDGVIRMIQKTDDGDYEVSTLKKDCSPLN